MAEKRYYWLKFKEDFLQDKRIKFIRKMPDGDRLLVIYLSMMAHYLKTEGVITYTGILPTCAEELALAIGEDTEAVKLAIIALEKVGLIEVWENQTIYLAEMQAMVGSEGSSAERVRRHREQKSLQSNSKPLQDVTTPLICHGEIEPEKREQRKEGDNGDKPPTIPYQEVIDLFNSVCKSYPKVTKLSEARKKAIKARFNGGYELEDFKLLFGAAEASPFLKGQNNRNWTATFDWLIADKNMAKVLDGNYTNIGNTIKGGNTRGRYDENEWADIGTSV